MILDPGCFLSFFDEDGCLALIKQEEDRESERLLLPLLLGATMQTEVSFINSSKVSNEGEHLGKQ